MLHDYQRRRIEILFDPYQDPLGAGYHTIQASIALGSGGFAGKGWMDGTQSQLDFLPERTTDFIFALSQVYRQISLYSHLQENPYRLLQTDMLVHDKLNDKSWSIKIDPYLCSVAHRLYYVL